MFHNALVFQTTQRTRTSVKLVNLGKEVAGKVSLRHVYEIAKIKSEDPPLQTMTMEQLCQMVVGIARSCGIEVVRDLDADEYRQFQADRQIVVEEQKKELELKREAMVTRTTDQCKCWSFYFIFDIFEQKFSPIVNKLTRVEAHTRNPNPCTFREDG